MRRILKSSSLPKKDYRRLYHLLSDNEAIVSNIHSGGIAKKGVIFDFNGDECLVILDDPAYAIIQIDADDPEADDNLDRDGDADVEGGDMADEE